MVRRFLLNDNCLTSFTECFNSFSLFIFVCYGKFKRFGPKLDTFSVEMLDIFTKTQSPGVNCLEPTITSSSRTIVMANLFQF